MSPGSAANKKNDAVMIASRLTGTISSLVLTRRTVGEIRRSRAWSLEVSSGGAGDGSNTSACGRLPEMARATSSERVGWRESQQADDAAARVQRHHHYLSSIDQLAFISSKCSCRSG